MYSQKTIDLLGKYIEKFPEVINVLLRTDSAKDTFKSEDMFPDLNTRSIIWILMFDDKSIKLINTFNTFNLNMQKTKIGRFTKMAWRNASFN